MNRRYFPHTIAAFLLGFATCFVTLRTPPPIVPESRQEFPPELINVFVDSGRQSCKEERAYREREQAAFEAKLFPELTDRDFVRFVIYREILHRKVDPAIDDVAGLENWVRELRRGASRSWVIAVNFTGDARHRQILNSAWGDDADCAPRGE